MKPSESPTKEKKSAPCMFNLTIKPSLILFLMSTRRRSPTTPTTCVSS